MTFWWVLALLPLAVLAGVVYAIVWVDRAWKRGLAR